MTVTPPGIRRDRVPIGPEDRATVRRPNQAHDGGEVDERRAAPVHRDVREQPMLDPVPLACPRRKMTDRDRQARTVGELLQLPLPQAQPAAVAAARIGRNHQRPGLSIRRAAHLLPPAPNRLHGEARGIVIDADADPAFVPVQVVNPVPDGLSAGWAAPGPRSRQRAPGAASSSKATSAWHS